MAKQLGGVVPPLCTPFKDEKLDLEALQFNIGRLSQTDLAGFLVLGSNGEGVYLTEAEQDAVWAAAREAIPEDRYMLAGTYAESTAVTAARIERAAELGADYALVLTPNYFKGQMTPERLIDHYRLLADRAPIPMLIYNMPANTGLNFPAGAVAELSGHPNIVGAKDSSGDVAQLSEMIRLTGDDFTIYQGSSKAYYQGLTVGAQGGIVATANALPKSCLAIWNAAQSGDHQRAADLHIAMTKFAILATAGRGVGYLKAAMDRMGYQGGECRRPLVKETDPALLAEMDQLLEPFRGIEEG